MDASISASLGAMGSLIGKLGMLLGEASEDDPGDPFHRLRLRLGFKDGVALVHLLRKDLEEISTNLEYLSEVEDPPLTAKCWMKEVRELSYDIEDYIDSFVRPARNSNITTRPRSRSSSISKISHVELAHLPKKKLANKRASNKISDFIIRAHDAKERYKRYELDWHNLRRRYLPVGPMLSTPYQEGTDLVIDGQMSDLIGTLASDGDHHLKVVSIVGSGGIGKTTLVRVLYNKIKGQFQLRAFIQMTRKPDVKLALRQMLTQVQWQQSHDHCEGLDLISKVRKHLQNKRYLIVVDDLWSPSEWNIINHAFPEGTQRSRIIVTTQIEDVALMCCSYHSGFVHEMRPQDSYSLRKLFFTKVFGSESENDCPDTFKEASNKIIEICGGLPLATVTMASLLSSYPVVLIEQWAYISDSLSSNLRTSATTEVVRQVLNLSYNNLTHYLKTCLLYLNMYPQGYTICKDDLVKQWAAEGFIDATEGRDMDRVARSYFDELINRRFLQPACIKYNNAMVSCTVHDTVHDLIAYKSAEENFVMVVDSYRKNVELRDKVHRLSLQFDDTKHAKKPADIRSSQVRSLFFFGLFRCMPSITDFKLLRVLNLQLSGHHGDDVFDLTGISELFHLRYLKVAGDVCIELPKHMQGLQYLETLDIDAELTAVPWDIIHLPYLLHLHLPFDINLMDWIGSMRFNSVQKLGKLTNLRDLRLTCSTTPPLDHLKQNMEALGSLLTGLGNLNRLTLVCGSFHTNAVVGSPSNVTISWDGFASPLLQRFEWSTICCTFSRVPKWTGEFGNLRVLKMTVKELLRDGVEILKGLPALTTLSIYVLAEPVAMTIFDKAGFSVLKYFKYRCSAPWLKFEAGAMPNLWKLKLGFNAHRVDQHDSTHISIGHLPGLQEISVKMGGAGADAESDLVLAAAVINHPSNPQINMQLVDWIFYGDKATEKKAHGRIETSRHSAATRIQNKFRGWKARKEFLLIRQRIVKIQAHVRGHLVRKHYRKIVRSVGFVEKVISRWNHRWHELRGFWPAEGSVEGSSGGSSSSSIQDKPSRDDYIASVPVLMPRLSCKFADPDSAVSSVPAAVRRVRPDTMSCSSDGCRDGSSSGSEEFRRPWPSKVAADDSVAPARSSDAAVPASWIDRKLLVDPKMLFVGDKIGEGAHGKVYKGKYGDQIVAIKVLNRGSTPEEKATLEACFIREVNMMCKVKHENLVKFIGACKEPLMVIVSELLPGMSLRSYLHSIWPSQLDTHTAISYALDIAHAMECVHANGIIHRDLKPDNLLLTANRKKLKLTDFGLAREETVTEMMTAETGTYRWMAPELYSRVTLRRGEKKHYTNKVDVYSFGIVLWELLTNRMPFEGMSNLQAAHAAAFQQKRPALPEETPQELVFIVQSCWVEDPAMRPSFSQIIRMLETFLMTIPPPPLSEPNEDEESEETKSSLSSRSSSGSSLVSRATSKLLVIRHLFASKKTGNGKA